LLAALALLREDRSGTGTALKKEKIKACALISVRTSALFIGYISGND